MTGAHARSQRTVLAVAGSVMSALALTACGDQPSAGEAVPGLNRSLAQVDAALADERYRVARRALDQLTSRAVEARRSGRLSPDQADQIIAAVTGLERELPLPLPVPATEPGNGAEDNSSGPEEDSGAEDAGEEEEEDD